MGALAQDLRYALRQLRKIPAFTTVAVLTLALGIGTNTAIFSVIDAVLLRSLAFHNASRLVVVKTTEPGRRDDIRCFLATVRGHRSRMPGIVSVGQSPVSGSRS